MFVICQNDYPLAVVNNTEEIAEEIRDEIQRKCDEKIKEPKYLHRNIFIHMRKVPIVNNKDDINNKLKWNEWTPMAYKK